MAFEIGKSTERDDNPFPVYNEKIEMDGRLLPTDEIVDDLEMRGGEPSGYDSREFRDDK